MDIIPGLYGNILWAEVPSNIIRQMETPIGNYVGLGLDYHDRRCPAPAWAISAWLMVVPELMQAIALPCQICSMREVPMTGATGVDTRKLPPFVF